jgi:hypothetical protein
LQKSTSELAKTLSKYSEKLSNFPQLTDDEIIAALKRNQGVSREDTGRAFGAFAGHLVAGQETDTVSHKVSEFLHKLFPLATIALGVVSFAADVSLYLVCALISK